MGRVLHVLGYGWASGRPHLRVAPEVAGEHAPRVVIGGRLSLRRLPGRRCIGWRDEETGGRFPCPDATVPAGPQCLACSRREGFWVCMTCTGFECPPLDPARERACRATHHLYLASFGSPVIKVGTAAGVRGHARVIEQGPLAAAHVAEGPGPLIKQMEALAVKQGFTERFRRSEKWRQFAGTASVAEARGWIAGGYEQLLRSLGRDYGDVLHAPHFIEQPELAEPVRALPGVQMVALGDGEGVSGAVLGARGHVALLDDGAGRVALDLGALKSRFVELDPEEVRTPARQLGLF